MDIPPKFGSTKEYQGTLGHKVNHSFDDNSQYIVFDSARFGVICAVQTKVPVHKNDEYFAIYHYPMQTAPGWYRLLYKEFANKYPSKADDEILAIIDEAELKKHELILK